MTGATPEEIITRAVDDCMDVETRVAGAGVLDDRAAKASIAALTAAGYSIENVGAMGAAIEALEKAREIVLALADPSEFLKTRLALTCISQIDDALSKARGE